MKKEQEQPLLFCRIIQECSGLKKPQFSGQKPKYKKFEAGTKIKAREHNYSDTPNSFIPCVKTIDGYIINTSHIIVIGEEHDATVLEEKKPELSEKLKERISRFANVTGGASGMIQDQRRKTKYMINGAITGGSLLFVYSLVKGGNRTNLFFIGVVLGGVVGKFIGGFKQDE